MTIRWIAFANRSRAGMVDVRIWVLVAKQDQTCDNSADTRRVPYMITGLLWKTSVTHLLDAHTIYGEPDTFSRSALALFIDCTEQQSLI